MRILGLLLGLAVICSNANAEIIMTIGSGTISSGAGPISIDVFARSTAGTESAFAFIADFRLATQGKFSNPPGTFGGLGFLGAGNINGPSSSFTIDAADSTNRTANLSLDFVSSQLFGSTDQRIATLSIDTTGVGAGTYNILGLNFDTGSGGAHRVNNGSFTVSAVPEPTSIALLSVVAVGVLGRKVLRRRKGKSA
ncbi:MAG: PEP-CTERM sorting domain-containing protein [Planctomycetota bacterium]|nr:PEP-CTERM sorting domain-containing protein [Planctomycetota bacterium]